MSEIRDGSWVRLGPLEDGYLWELRSQYESRWVGVLWATGDTVSTDGWRYIIQKPVGDEPNTHDSTIAATGVVPLPDNTITRAMWAHFYLRCLPMQVTS